jgi:hypothetical protein
MRRTGRAVVFAVLAAVVVVWMSSVSAAEKRAGVRTAPQIGRVLNIPPGGNLPDVIGTLRYDNDIPASRDGTLNIPIGNNFNVGFLNPHSITKVSFRLAGCYVTPYPGALVHIFDVNPTVMTVMQLAQFSGGAGPGNNCAGGAVYSGMVPAPIMGHTGPFVAGIHNTPFAGCAGMTAVGGTCEGVALSAGTMDPGMGFHAVRVNGAMYTAIVPNKNAIFRATGDNLPVELMSFGVK